MRNYLIAMATFAGLYGILALGLNLIWGMAGMINLGLAGFFAVGGYASALLTARLGAPIVVGVIAAMLVAAAAGVVMAMVTAQPARASATLANRVVRPTPMGKRLNARKP